jgi:uncharacterized protein (TIGR02001 family)
MRVLTRSLFAASVISSALALPSSMAAEQEHHVGGEVTFATQYIFRGLTQTNEKPALQGGIDYVHSSGLYVKGWASNVSLVSDTAASENTGPVSVSLEMDFALGNKGKVGDWSYDVGLIRYQFPGTYPSDYEKKPHTSELYGQVGWQGITLKVSSSLGQKTFGIDDSKRSYYAELGAAFPLNDYLTLNLHAGRQKFKGETSGVSNAIFDYNDYSIELAASFWKDWNAGLGFTGTNAKDEAYTILENNIGDKQVYGFVKRNF